MPDYLSALFGHWVASMSGVISLSIGVWLRIRRWRSNSQDSDIPNKAFLIIGLVFVFYAGYQTWGDEHRKALQLQVNLDALTVPHLVATISSTFVAPSGGTGENSLVTIEVHIKNTGAPSIAEHFAIAAFRGGKQFKVDVLPARNIVLYFGPNTNSPGGSYSALDYLPRKAFENPIPHGGATGGFMQAVVSGLKQKETAARGTTLRVTFTDVAGKACQAEYAMGVNITPIIDPRKLYKETEPHP
jgi:hypothetical protein